MSVISNTSLKQSKRLLELGLNPETADMFYIMYKNGELPRNEDKNLKHNYQDEQGNWYSLELYEEYLEEDCFKKNGTYAWSLGAMLNIIPNYQLQTQLSGKIGILFGCKNELKIIEADTVINTVFQLVVWLLENGYIKTEKK